MGVTRKIFKMEYKRAVRSRSTWISLGVGTAIAALHYFRNITPYVDIWLYENVKQRYPYQVFEAWIGGSVSHMEGMLYYIILPLLAVLPYSASFLQDIKSGYVKQIYTRAERKSYLLAKFSIVFLAGGIAAVIPLLLNFMLCMMSLPMLLPQNVQGTFINANVLWYGIYETKPVLYECI